MVPNTLINATRNEVQEEEQGVLICSHTSTNDHAHAVLSSRQWLIHVYCMSNLNILSEHTRWAADYC